MESLAFIGHSTCACKYFKKKKFIIIIEIAAAEGAIDIV